MNRRLGRKFVSFASVFISIIMLFSTFAAYIDAYAEEDSSVTVTVAMQKDGAFLDVPQKITVKDGLAEEYGYTVAEKKHDDETVDEPTFFDALVAVHKAKYGDSFNKDTAEQYLKIGSGGYLTKAFGDENAACGFYINSEIPADENGTGYCADTAELKNNDIVEFWFYQDTESWSDCYTSFDTAEKNVGVGVSFDLTMSMFVYDYEKGVTKYAVDGEDTENNYITINTVNSYGSISEPLKDAEGNVITPDKNGKISLSFEEEGSYIVTAQGFVNGASPVVAPFCIVTVEEVSAPESITIKHNAADVLTDGKIVCKKGDKFKLTAYDQDGKETPVKWTTASSSSYVEIDENTGEISVKADLSGGSTSYWYFTATSALDETVSSNITVKATGFLFSEYNKTQTVALSEDGQTAKNVSVSGGQNGYNIWSYNIPEGVAELAADPGTGGTIKFNVLRPGTISTSFKLSINEKLTDTAEVTVTGVAVEDADGKNTKTYLGINSVTSHPTAQLSAYTAAGRTISRWESADEDVAKVDNNGLVTAEGIGSTIITAIDSEGTKGGIKVVVQSEETPYFESLEFAATALSSGAWIKDETFSPTNLTYDLPIKNYSTSSLTLQASTLYDTDKYTAIAEYTDVNGEKQKVEINSGKITTLANQPFDDSVMIITLTDRNNAENKTIYTFNVSRPRDKTKAVKSNGIVLVPAGRTLSSTAYNGIAEGTMQKADESGALTSGTGVNSTQYYYRTFVYDDVESFKLNLSSSTVYAHIRYSTDGGVSWSETQQGGGATKEVELPESGAAEIIIQIIDDSAYAANTKAGKDGFEETEPAEYRIWIDKVTLSLPVIISAEASGGDWYPDFKSDMYSYWIVAENGAGAPVLTYTVEEGNTVQVGTIEQTADENGNYTITLGTSQTSIAVTSADGKYTNIYKFGYRKKSAFDVPDKVADYLCIGSQYTNAVYGINPENTLSGNLKSLGNFGGYITYYYEEAVTDNPNNKYGMDFYVIGNSSETNIDSMAELGQVYVSEDGETWYALAGSEHYEDNAVWDYTITYRKGEDGKAYWTDNYGNSAVENNAVLWPSEAYYYMNDVAEKDSYTFKGVLFKSQLGSITGDGTTNAFAAKARFGYADYYASNISGTNITDVNPYVENPSMANGFDLAWAVDEDGIPVDVSSKEFHYIRVATASNIWAGAFKEKSTEVAYVVRTSSQESEVGKTSAPAGVTISDGTETIPVSFTESQKVYPVNVGSMKYVSIKVKGAESDDNIYINNQRVSSDTAASGFKVTEEKGETLVRVIVQNGEKEPAVYLLKLTGNASESDELIEGVRINAGGTVREAETSDGQTYTVSVGHRVDSVSINPVAAPDVTYTVNSEAAAESYSLDYGENLFTIAAETSDGGSQTVTLKITRENAPAQSGNTITVKFALYGDEEHGESEIHTYKNDRSELPVWISETSYKADSGSTVLDVFEKALSEAGFSWKNDGGNYISEINGLAQFDNGSLSGWMYLYNGKYSSLGIAEQTLKNGDRIIFHYTDDYTQEQGSEEWTSNSSGNKPDTETEQPEETVSFSDVEKGSWYEDAVSYVVRNNLFRGISENEFMPEGKMTRAMFVTVLYRLENPSAVTGNTVFEDVPEGEWYSEAASWAAENGIVKGISETEFAPDEYITREQMAAVIYRYVGMKGWNTDKSSDLSQFEDVGLIQSWALDAMKWANAAEIVKGTGDSSISPSDTATRAQTAVIFMRLCENIIKYGV